MKEFTAVMKALSDQGRVKILKMLQHRPMYVCEIRAALKLAQPTVSNHLKLLEAAGLATFEKDGKWILYSLSDGSQSPYASLMLGSLRHWLNDDDGVSKLVDKLDQLRREDVCG